MIDLVALNARIRDRASPEWLTPSQRSVWQSAQAFEGPPHRVINIFGADGSGKTYLGWLMERLSYATFAEWGAAPGVPALPRLVLDNAPADRYRAREARALVESLGIQQVILLTRTRIDEPALPTLELRVTPADISHFRANLFRHLRLVVPDDYVRSYAEALALLTA